MKRWADDCDKSSNSSNSSKVVKILVGNKADLESSRVLWILFCFYNIIENWNSTRFFIVERAWCKVFWGISQVGYLCHDILVYIKGLNVHAAFDALINEMYVSSTHNTPKVNQVLLLPERQPAKPILPSLSISENNSDSSCC